MLSQTRPACLRGVGEKVGGCLTPWRGRTAGKGAFGGGRRGGPRGPVPASDPAHTGASPPPPPPASAPAALTVQSCRGRIRGCHSTEGNVLAARPPAPLLWAHGARQAAMSCAGIRHRDGALSCPRAGRQPSMTEAAPGGGGPRPTPLLTSSHPGPSGRERRFPVWNVRLREAVAVGHSRAGPSSWGCGAPQDSFESAKRAPQHQKRPGLRPLEVLPGGLPLPAPLNLHMLHRCSGSFFCAPTTPPPPSPPPPSSPPTNIHPRNEAHFCG